MNEVFYQIVHDNLILAQAETKARCIELLSLVHCPTIVRIEQREQTQYVTVSNRIWMNKSQELPTQYTHEFTRSDILEDIAEKICRMNGYTMQKVLVN